MGLWGVRVLRVVGVVRVVTVSLDNMHSDYIPFHMVLTVKKSR